MAEAYKVLGSSAPSAATQTGIYTVPASTEAIVSTITICNRSSTPTAFRVAILSGGGTVADEDYIAYDHPIGGNELVVLSLGAGLAATDEIEVYNTLATLTFKAFGMEITA